MQFTEGTHYGRRESQPSPAPHRSKEVVDCMLCSDPGDDDNVQVGTVHIKRSKEIRKRNDAATHHYMIVECLILFFFLLMLISKHF